MYSVHPDSKYCNLHWFGYFDLLKQLIFICNVLTIATSSSLLFKQSKIYSENVTFGIARSGTKLFKTILPLLR